MTLFVQIALVASVFIVGAGVLGISLANAKNNQRSQTEALYEKENKALGQALDRSERRVVQLELELSNSVQRISVLEDTVSGAEEIKKLRAEWKSEWDTSEERRKVEHDSMMMLLKDNIAMWRNKRGELG
ncbi:MAG: hypothetical protein LC792_04010 [Actinobacteria bacterium]|nr:hypothetical protein [Actinomycetota bacterium]